MRVADEDRVVAAGEGAVQRRADAGVGLGAGDDEAADAARRQLGLEVGVLERVAIALVDERLGVVALQLVDVLPLVAALGQLVVGVCCTQITGTSSARALSTRVLMLPITSSRWWAPATTPFCTSITRRAVLGRFDKLVIRASLGRHPT